MTILSAKGDVDGSTVAHNQGMLKSGLGKMWQAFVDLFGTDSGALRTVHETARLNGPGKLDNLSLVPSVAANALTMTVKTRAGAVPSAADPVLVAVRNATLATGDSLLRQVSAALALTISSGSTLGHGSGMSGDVWWYLCDSDGAGTMKLACSSTYYGVSLVGTTVAEGGGGGADSASAIYSDGAYVGKALRLVGHTIDTQTVAGTWAALPTTIELWPCDPPPSGVQIQSISAVANTPANSLTISAGPLSLEFRSATLGSGAVTKVTGTPASLVVTNGSTLGTVSGVKSRLAVLALNNGGALEQAVVNIAGGTDLTESGLISTTAEGGGGGADAANVVYSATARTNVPYRVIGYIESTQATAGAWVTAPSTIQGAGGEALTAMSSIGYGQTWQDVSGSRASGTTYRNDTGRPIMVSVAAGGTGSAVVLTVGGVAVARNENGAATSGNWGCSAIVPPGNSYSAAFTGSIVTWAELR